MPVVRKLAFNGLPALARSAALFLLLLLVAARALAAGVGLAWDPVTNASGYMVYYGPAAGNYPTKIDVGNTTVRTVANLTDGATYHFAVTAYDASHKESGFSSDVTTTVPAGPPVANFTASATTGTAPLAMNFANTSTGSITSYAWSFGDGTTSTAKAPSHVYSSAGVYAVSLTVTGSGGSNTKTIPNYVTVKAPAGVDATSPTVPSTLSAGASATNTINLTWKSSSDNVGITGYRIERCQGTGCTTFAQIAIATGTSYSNTGLVAGTSYGYRLGKAALNMLTLSLHEEFGAELDVWSVHPGALATGMGRSGASKEPATAASELLRELSEPGGSSPRFFELGSSAPLPW